MLSGDGADRSGRRRDSSLARFAVRIWDMVEMWLTTSLMSRGLSVREAMDRRCVRLSLACRRREAQAERPLSAATHPDEVPTLIGRRTWDGLGGPIAVGSEVYETLDLSRTWGGGGGGTVAGSAVDADISASEARTDVGGPSSDVIIRGWVDLSRPDAAGAAVPARMPLLASPRDGADVNKLTRNVRR